MAGSSDAGSEDSAVVSGGMLAAALDEGEVFKVTEVPFPHAAVSIAKDMRSAVVRRILLNIVKTFLIRDDHEFFVVSILAARVMPYLVTKVTLL